jgi:hypothetical protein
MIFESGAGSEPQRLNTVFSPTRPTTANAKQSPRLITGNLVSSFKMRGKDQR